MASPEPASVLESQALLEEIQRPFEPELPGGWCLSSAMRHHEGGVLLVVTHPEQRATLGLQVRVTEDDAPAWLRTAHLDLISHIPEDTPESEGLHILEPLASRLKALDTDDRRWRAASALGDVAPEVAALALPPAWAPEATSPFAFGRVYVLDLSSDCGQRCTFCSTRAKFSPVTTPAPDAKDRFLLGMRAARRDGYRVLRLSGLDPLTHPLVYELLSEAVTMGFEHIHIYSPFTQLAAEEARSALVDALGPAQVTLHVPVYGPDAVTHDAVTGVCGSFDAVTEALTRLVEQGMRGSLNLLTVVTRGNLTQLAATSRWLRQWRAPIQVFLPFPTTRADDDAFFKVAAPYQELITAFASCTPPLGLAELPPCVRFFHEVKTGQPTLTTGGFHPMTALLGTLFEHADYRRVGDLSGNTFTIPVRRCPHAQTCALAAVCPKAVYEAYDRCFGLDELSPVSPEALRGVSPELAELIRPA